MADYTRYTRSPRAAFVGVLIQYGIADAWMLILGALLVLSRDLTDPAALPAAVVAGGLIAVLALLALTVAETDDAFANAYSGAVSVQNLAPRVPQRLLVVATTGTGVLGALLIDLVSFQSFLLLLGSFFVPLFAVLLADWLVASRSYTRDTFFRGPSWRPGLIVAWVMGFALYQWLYPTGPSWWVVPLTTSAPRRGAFRSRCRASSSRSGSRCRSRSRPGGSGHSPRIARIAVIGHLCRDVVAGAPPRAGGGVLYASLALGRLGAAATATAACAEADRGSSCRRSRRREWPSRGCRRG